MTIAPAPIRVPAGTPEGGRFTGRARPESSIVLATAYVATPMQAMRIQATYTAMDIYDQCPGEPLGAALGRLRQLADTRHPDEVRLITAEYIALALREGDDGQELAREIEDIAPSMLRGLNIEDYAQFNPADRPGEDEYIGYHWDQIAEDLAQRWSDKAGRIVGEITASAELAGVDPEAADRVA